MERNAQDVMGRLKKRRESLTPDISRWFGAIQRIIGQPKEDEPFRNYLQRAMSMKSEIDNNLINPGNENIESVIKEIVPLLYKDIAKERMEGNKSSQKTKQVKVVNHKKVSERDSLIDSTARDNINPQEDKYLSNLSPGDKIILEVEQKTGGRVDFGDYDAIRKLNAGQVMEALRRIANNSGDKYIVKLIDKMQSVPGIEIIDKTFDEYVDSFLTVEKIQRLQNNIKDDIKIILSIEEDEDLDMPNLPIDNVLQQLRKNKDKLKFTKSKDLAQLFGLGGIAIPRQGEKFGEYFNRIKNELIKESELSDFLEYAVPELRRAMNKTVFKKGEK